MLTILIDNATHSSPNVDCSAYHTLPSNLDDANGGSAPYGGPIQNGYVHISSDKFLASGSGSYSKGSNIMSFTLNAKSAISLITAVGEDHYFDIEYSLYNKRSLSFVEAVHAAHTTNQRTELFIVDVREPTVFEIRLSHSSTFSRKSCPFFELDLVIDKYSHVLDSLVCPNFAGLSPLPQTSLHLDSSNPTTTDFVSSNITSNFITQHTSNGKFTFPISITADVDAYLNANVGYKSLSNAFSLSLKRTGSNYFIGSSSFAMVAQRSGQTNVAQYLSGYLAAGTYTLTIEQPDLPFFQSGLRCYPFVWDILLRSHSASNYVDNVEPPAAQQLNPQKELNILITLSERPYKGGHPVDITDTKSFKDAFFLQNSAGQTIHPSNVELRSMDGTTWLLIFAPGSLQQGQTYHLGLVPDALQNHNGVSVVMSGRDFTYSTISSHCSGHGEYQNGVCVCSEGYAGITCEHCALGYVLSGDVCVRNQSSTSNCKSDTCGCRQRANNGECLGPLGTCTELAGGSVSCSCDPAYHATGERCEKCLPGYYGYPLCQKREGCNPSCSKNAISCDVEKNKCICPINWAGTTCSECAPGYSGSQCTKTSPQDNPSGWAAFFKTFALIVGAIMGLSAIGWMVWWRYKIWRARRPRHYLPLGLEELEGATELHGGDDDDDDAFADDPMFSSSPQKGGEISLLEHPEVEEQQQQQQGTINRDPSGDDDFNPRGETPSTTRDNTSLIDL